MLLPWERFVAVSGYDARCVPLPISIMNTVWCHDLRQQRLALDTVLSVSSSDVQSRGL